MGKREQRTTERPGRQWITALADKRRTVVCRFAGLMKAAVSSSSNGAVPVPSEPFFERGLLGYGFTHRPVAELIASLEPDLFYSPAHRSVVAAIKAVVSTFDDVVSVELITNELRASEQLQAIGGEQKMLELLMAAPI